MKRNLCLLLMLFTFAFSFAKKEYIQFSIGYPMERGIFVSGNLPSAFQEKNKRVSGKITEKELEEILGRKLDTLLVSGCVAYLLNYFADYGYELQQAIVDKERIYTYILVRDTEEKNDQTK